MTDLVSGRYGAQDPFWRILGMPTNVLQSDVPVRSNAWVTGFSTLVDITTSATKKGPIVAIPVQEGDVITKVSTPIGAKEGKTSPFWFFALYSGTTTKKEATLLGQTTVSEAAQKPSKLLTAELEKTILITSANAPNGYIFGGLISEITTVCSQVGVEIPTACQKEWFTGCPEVFSTEVEQKEKSVAAEKVKTETASTKVPFIFLS